MKVFEVFMFIVAFLHVGFFVLEAFLWKGDFARKRFQLSKEKAEITAPLALNQGVYNLFLAAGFLFAFFNCKSDLYHATTTFFFACVIVAGLVGAATVSKRIFFIQALPAIIGLGLLLGGI